MLTAHEQTLTADLHRSVKRIRRYDDSTPAIVRTLETNNLAQLDGERNRVRELLVNEQRDAA